jgi:transcriptional regulator with XRE-family HTH domain
MGRFMSKVAFRLKSERVRLRLTQKDFGAVGGVGANAQVKYETGERSPNASYLARVAAIGVDVLYVLTGHRSIGPDVEAEPDEYEFLLIYSSLPTHEKTLISELIKSLSGRSNHLTTV